MQVRLACAAIHSSRCQHVPGDAAVLYKQQSADKAAGKPAAGFVGFQTNYLCVYLLMMGADWIQGPYVYAL